MTGDLRLIIELQEIDSSMSSKAGIIGAVPQKILSVEQPLKESQELHDKSRQTYDALQKKKKERERLMDDMGERIKKLKARVSEIKTNKEYQAFLKEIEAAEKEWHAGEDEILVLMEETDVLQNQLSAEEKKVKAAKEEVKAFRAKLDEEVAGLQKEMDELKVRRDDLVKGIDPEVYELYSKVIRARKGLAVVEAKGEICRGCNMNIPPQLFVEIKKNDKIIQCPQCNRILYWKL